jgi:restriction system protein
MTLVDGVQLVRIIGTGLLGEALGLPVPAAASIPTCPVCGSAMVRRTARQGPRVGHDFWGCSTFPARHGTAPILDEVPIAL